MAFLARIVRFLLWLVVAVWLGRLLVRWLLPAQVRKQTQPGPPQAAKPLFRDPWCGTFVSPEISHSLEQAGQVLHFCSAECRERYLVSQRHAAGG
ncbi:MAG: hypothetical protein HY237_07920 [Acidobacteria bacterium]|nr:hypothetical protein [Acidobacteriota bacterium]